MRNILKVVFVIIGTMIGAGFASGQEVYLFFFSYGIEGLIGLLISGLIIGLVIYKTFIIVNKYGISTYKEFLDILIKKDGKIKPIINTIINIFILITFFIMIAGFGAYFEQELGINSLIGSGILSIIVFAIFMTSVKGVVKANELLVPILIGFLVIIGVINLKDLHVSELENYIIRTNFSSFVLSAVLYSSYNSILLIPVLLTLKNYIKDKKQILKIAIISTIIIVLLSIVVFLLLVRVDVDITKLEMPAVYVVSNMFKMLKYVYGFIILGSIFTTAISLGTSFLQNTTKNKKSYTQIALIMCITSVIISKIGFSNLVSLLYPIFGYLGLLQILKLVITKMQIK
ncbi:MAG: hypothetical protein HFJ35_01970 [Clostridia bacterium]|nr:hypothetical protein [Clostridia bacterium]